MYAKVKALHTSFEENQMKNLLRIFYIFAFFYTAAVLPCKANNSSTPDRTTP